MIRTILVDDHRMFCDGLSKLLDESGKFKVVQQFHNGDELLNNIKKLNFDLLILDIDLNGISGLDVLHRLRGKNPSIKVAILSMHQELIYSREAFLGGADAYLIKSMEVCQLIDCLLKIMAGETIFNKSSNADRPQNSIFSKQETKILKLMAEGKTSDQIAAFLCISSLTVKTHRRNMMSKLKAKNSVELLSIAFSQNLV